jgi:hypothetical protein
MFQKFEQKCKPLCFVQNFLKILFSLFLKFRKTVASVTTASNVATPSNVAAIKINTDADIDIGSPLLPKLSKLVEV